jgi:hypothetical protein
MQSLLTSDPIELTFTAFTPLTVRHGYGRPIKGWLVVWADSFLGLRVVDEEADTRTELTLVADASGSVRLLLL